MVLAQTQGDQLLVIRPISRHALCALFLLKFAPTVQACAVCFGDPESPMTKGAAAGVIVLVGVVGFVLVGIMGVTAFWIHRGHRAARATESQTDRLSL